MHSKVLIIYTGGTIGMINDPNNGSLRPFDFKHILNFIPDLKQFNIEIDTYSFDKPIDSSDADIDLWIKTAKVIEKNYLNYDGFVILHGTDTMAYTGSALSYMISNLDKPVILTGAQLPIGTLRTDGKENLITAIEIAAAKDERGKARVPEVCIYFETKLYRANRTHKYNAEYFDAFESPNYPTLAEAGIKIHYNDNAIAGKELAGITKFNYNFNNNIGILKIHPGINLNFLEATIETEGLKGLIIETYGTGNAPTNKNFINSLKKAIDKGIIVYNVSQCNAGRVEMEKYATGKKLKELGIASGKDITIEAAVTKLMFLLGQGMSKEKVKFYLEKNIAGEIKE